ncbi:hypothetical protein MMC17_008435 [Xylographa soralifera]|nr:hypothetical protein [Xylographa soralifera]
MAKLRAKAMIPSLARGRRSRGLVILVCAVLFLVYFWKSPNSVSLLHHESLYTDVDYPEDLTYRIPLSQHHETSATRLPFAELFCDESQTHQLSQDTTAISQNRTCSKHVQSRDPSFHVVIPASASNNRLCKTLLSSFLLNYPSPTLVNFGEIFTGDNWDNGSHAGKIKGVYNFLSGNSQVYDDDLVLVIDGFDVWFQLPPEVLVKRYHKLVQDANRRLRKQYGATTKHVSSEGTKKSGTQIYEQSVVFGADKLCWPNAPDDPACASLPESTLPNDSYGKKTDQDPDGFNNRPKYLNSGTIIGPVSDVRAVYKRALEKVDQGFGAIGDQFVFAEILGEQEYNRDLSNLNARNSWSLGLSGSLNPFRPSLPVTRAVKNITLIQNQRYEYSIGLDYTSSLFQTMTHSGEDVRFITYNNITSRSSSKRNDLPLDVRSARPPYPSNDTLSTLMTNSILPLSKSLEKLTSDGQNTWLSTPLATNLRSLTVPTLLHINGEKSLLDSWWPSVWFQPNARALLRHYIRTPQPFLLGTVAGQELMWDMRGGRGGVWTQDGRWLEWGEICEGVEESVFGDGKGKWGEEEGDGRTWNSFGKQVTGKVDGDN